jgi:hypothetical protein
MICVPRQVGKSRVNTDDLKSTVQIVSLDLLQGVSPATGLASFDREHKQHWISVAGLHVVRQQNFEVGPCSLMGRFQLVNGYRGCCR